MFSQQQLGPVIVGSFLGNYWPAAVETLVAEPAPLPATYTNFRQAVMQAELHRRANEGVRARVDGRLTPTAEAIELSGEVVDVRQGILAPATNEFPVQHSLTLDVDGDHVVVGGPGAFVEDVEADRVELTPLPGDTERDPATPAGAGAGDDGAGDA